MLGPPLALPGVTPGNVGVIDAAAALSLFDPSQLVLSPVQAYASHNAYSQAPNPALEDQMTKPILKRKRSMFHDLPRKTNEEIGRAQPHTQDSEDYLAEQKRTKLGYHRTSIACGHCRRRKIRCLIPANEESNRCSNCIRLKKECSFHPVEQTTPHSKPKPQTSKGNLQDRGAFKSGVLSPTSTVPPPKRGHSDSSVKYSKIPFSSNPDVLGFQDRKRLSPELSPEFTRVAQEQRPILYPASVDHNWFAPSFPPLQSTNEQTQQQNPDYSGSAINSLWASAVSPRTRAHPRSPSWHDLNQRPVFGSSQSDHIHGGQKFAWTHAPQRSTSHPGSDLGKSYMSQTTQFGQPVTESTALEYQRMLAREVRMQATTSDTINIPLATTSSELTMLSLPTMNLSQSISPFVEQQQPWPMFAGQHQDHSERGASFDDHNYDYSQWYHM